MSGYNFTERVRRALAMAREEAVTLRHDYVGTEHLLLGIIAEGEGVAMTVLENLGVDTDGLAKRVKELVPEQRASRSGPDLPYTSSGKKVLELAMSEARELNHSYVGTEHLLLGLLRQEKGTAARALTEVGVSLEAARAETLRLLGTERPTGDATHRRGVWLARSGGRRLDRVEISLRFEDGEVVQRSFATAREAAEYLWRGGVV